jgi:serine/threonine protein kinase
LQHPNIVQIHDIAQQDDEPFLVLEFVGGGNLTQKIAGRPQPPGWAAELVETLARAMHYAHQQGIIHRDLKPANVLLTEQGVPKITDFGLTKWLDEGLSQTISGELVGTPGYMAPEQAWGKSKEVGIWTDVYALGAILYELLTGRPPFVGETRTSVSQQVQIEEPEFPRRLLPGVVRDLETICLKCLEKDPARRYGSAEARRTCDVISSGSQSALDRRASTNPGAGRRRNHRAGRHECPWALGP